MKFDFLNSKGEKLSGRLETPKGEPRAYALFAHCFTCSKDIIAASTIARELTNHGIAVLRFDFTGLGNSEGDFSNTNFSSNVEDLVAACSAIKQQYQAPEILIGHSLGGAAVLKAASLLDEVKAVVTVAAPSSVKHVTGLFQESVDEIKSEGQAKVQLAGRPFVIKKQFVDDLGETELLSDIANFKKSLLVLHSPTDNTVSIDHAAKIFQAAKHPKSFISLDSADHLLMNKNDAAYVALTIGAWVDRYLDKIDIPKNPQRGIEHGDVIVQSRPNHKFTQDIFSDSNHLIADEPLRLKGNNLGMNPYELLLSALGACTSMTMRMYADRKKMNLDQVQVHLNHKKIHAEDCQECATKDGLVDQIHKKILISGDLSEEEKTRIFEIAEKCPVNRTLKSEISITAEHGDLY